ncbi:glutamate 5-kinase [Croceivirga sp. JEA036]|uniref:glutamate 5-kinase n=1 Tax=Croceivirga sp. JEA036 TaxID=2721162 RepID=UPI00143C16D6|nr:glutamate 5-kinase [Croceivirga sp. JEA036]NJB36711.1 glutamate 5-kinase [Croceivirga sp. JEA036]
MKKRVLVKIGSNTLTKETDQISRGKIEDIGRQLAALKDQYEFILVCSGAIATAKQFVQLEHTGKDINVKQALAAIGQPRLMHIFQENFRELGLFTSQCLFSYSDLQDDKSRQNIKNTIDVLLQNNVVPIINENDTVATEEIKFGDNDKLAAYTAAFLEADLLIIATNTNGVYSKASMEKGRPETILEVRDLQAMQKEISTTKSSHGTGGMQSKIEASAIAQEAQIETWIVNGLLDNFILDSFNATQPFTKIIAT